MVRLASFPTALLLSLSLGAQTVLVVDDDLGDGVDFDTVSGAAAFAPDGAILLVRDGTYSTAVQVTGKSLTIVAEEGNSPLFLGSGAVSVSDLAAGQSFTMVGIRIDATNGGIDPVVLSNNQGTIWIEDCVLLGGSPALFASGNGAIVSNSASVVFQDCTISGGDTSLFGLAGSAVNSVGSNVYVYGCDLTGGPGPASTSVPSPGGDGVLLNGGFLFAAHSTLTGGDGGEGGNPFFCVDGGDGGSGIRLTGSNPVAELYDVALAGGGPGQPGSGTATGSCVVGQPGVPSTVEAGVLNESALSPHTFDLPFPVRSGASATLTFGGTPGESVWFLYGTDPTALFIPGVSGTLLANVPFFLIFGGTIGATGTLDFAVEGPALPPGAGGMVWYLQSFFLNVPSGFLLGPGGALIVVDPKF